MNKITDDIVYVGVSDKKIDLFEGQYRVPDGMTYNSYVILDEKIAVMDTVDAGFTDEWLENVNAALGGRTPDYLVVQHMEPDHSANIMNFAEQYKSAVIVASQKAFDMMNGFFGTDFSERRLVVGEGSTLTLGKHTLTFVTAPMVHWPEVIVTYDSFDKVLFSADGFGRFGSADPTQDWANEARRYYIGIVGKYGAQVQTLLRKASSLEIEKICPLHGPVLTENLGFYLGLYNTWSSYEAESGDILIAYTSVYGNTAKAVRLLEEKLRKNGENVIVLDLARCDMSEAVAQAFRCAKLVLATTTYNAGIFPFMRDFIEHLTERGFRGRTVGFIENGAWAPMAAKVMREMLSGSKEIVFAEPVVKLKCALNGESAEQIEQLAESL